MNKISQEHKEKKKKRFKTREKLYHQNHSTSMRHCCNTELDEKQGIKLYLRFTGHYLKVKLERQVSLFMAPNVTKFSKRTKEVQCSKFLRTRVLILSDEAFQKNVNNMKLDYVLHYTHDNDFPERNFINKMELTQQTLT